MRAMLIAKTTERILLGKLVIMAILPFPRIPLNWYRANLPGSASCSRVKCGVKKILLGTMVSLAVVGSSIGATCVGATPCHAYSTCGFCGYCAKQGGICARGGHAPKHHAAMRKHKAVVVAQK